jgi:putative lipoprotein
MMNAYDHDKRVSNGRFAGLLVLLTALAAGCTPDDAASTAPVLPPDAPPDTDAAMLSGIVTGTLTYRERMLLKPGSIVEVWLLDTSLADVAATEIAYQRIDNPGQQPVAYRLEFDPADIREGMQYSVRATVSRDGQLLFTTDRHYGVLTRGNGNTADLELIRVNAPSAAEVEDMTPDASLTNTYWKLTSIGGEPFKYTGEGREPQLMLVPRDLQARGRTGCNSFTGHYETYGDYLRFGNLAVTQMACLSGMNVEREYLDALDRVDRFDINGESMTLYAGEEELLGFAAIYF